MQHIDRDPTVRRARSLGDRERLPDDKGYSPDQPMAKRIGVYNYIKSEVDGKTHVSCIGRGSVTLREGVEVFSRKVKFVDEIRNLPQLK